MNFKLVLKTYSQLRQLSDDEAALLATLRAMSDSERELLVESLSPPVKVKAVKRKIEHCIAARGDEPCGLTRRAAIHKDTGNKDYHEFQELRQVIRSTPVRSKRASSLAEKIAGTTNSSKPPLCDFEIDGKVCKGSENDGIHDAALGYLNHHPFVSSSPVHNAVGQSSTKDDEANSGTDSDAVSSAAGG